MHSIVTTFREAVIKVEVANFGAAIDTLIDQDAVWYKNAPRSWIDNVSMCLIVTQCTQVVPRWGLVGEYIVTTPSGGTRNYERHE